MITPMNGFFHVYLAIGDLPESVKEVPKLSTWDTFTQLFTIIVIFILILAATYYSTKLLGKVQGKRFKGGNLEIIETISIANGKLIQLVKAGNKYILISVTKDRVEFLVEIPADQIVIKEIIETNVKFSFDDILKKVSLRKNSKD